MPGFKEYEAYDALGLEPERLVEGEGALVDRRGHATDDATPARRDLGQEPLVERAPDALAPTVDLSDMITGALWSIGYAIIAVWFAFWYFLRKDITS